MLTTQTIKTENLINLVILEMSSMNEFIRTYPLPRTWRWKFDVFLFIMILYRPHCYITSVNLRLPLREYIPSCYKCSLICSLVNMYVINSIRQTYKAEYMTPKIPSRKQPGRLIIFSHLFKKKSSAGRI